MGFHLRNKMNKICREKKRAQALKSLKVSTYIEVQQRIDRDKWRERPGLQDHRFGGRSLVEQKRVFGNGEIEIWVFEMNNCFYFSNPPKLSNSASSTSTNTKTHSVSATLHYTTHSLSS